MKKRKKAKTVVRWVITDDKHLEYSHWIYTDRLDAEQGLVTFGVHYRLYRVTFREVPVRKAKRGRT